MIHTEALTIGYYKGRKAYPVQQSLNLTAAAGEFVALIGTNGCGKSTLLRTLAGLQQPLAGTISYRTAQNTYQSLAETGLQDRARLISLVLTDPVHLGYLTVYQLVAMGRHPYTSFSGVLDENDKQLVNQALGAVHLESYADRMFSELSDGEKQRACIAKAIAQDTPVVLLDEPTSFLDLPNRIESMLFLRKLAHEFNKCIVLSTHEIDLAIRLADTLWLMRKGEPLHAGSPSGLMSSGVLQETFSGEHFGFHPQTGQVIIF